MREFTYRIDKPFQKDGIGPSSVGRSIGTGKEELDWAFNCVMTRNGLVNNSLHYKPNELFTEAQATSAGLNHDEPYPQFKALGKYKSAGGNDTNIYYAFGNTTVHPLTFSSPGTPPSCTTIGAAITLKKYDSPGTTATLSSSGEAWDIHTLNDGVFFAFNGRSVIFRHNLGTYHQDFFDSDNKFLVYNYSGQSNMNIGTGCIHNGRLLMGGLDTKFFGDNYYKEYIYVKDGMLEEGHIDINIADDEIANNSKGVIWWSSIGGGDMYMPFYPDIIMNEGIQNRTLNPLDENSPKWEELVWRNQGGFMSLPWVDCSIKRLLPFGNGVMVYTDKGIGYLKAINKGELSTYGFEIVSDTLGIAWKDNVDGNLNKHCFVDNYGIVYFLKRGKGGGIQLEEKYRAVQAEDISAFPGLVKYDEPQDTFYVSNKNTYNSYIINEYGITNQGLFPSDIIELPLKSAWLDNNVNYRNSYWVFDKPSDSEKFSMTIMTEPIDFEVPGMKTLKSVFVDYVNEGWEPAGNIAITCWARTKNNGTWNMVRQEIKLNDDGVCYLNVTAFQFKFALVFKDATGTSLDTKSISVNSLDIKWSLTDKRFQRGFYPQQGGQSKK